MGSYYRDYFGLWTPTGYDEEYGKYKNYGVAFPVFVLRETETGVTLYSTCYGYKKDERSDNKLSSPLILVGGFMKLKEEFMGQTILKIYSEPYSYSEPPKIKEKWTCVDVSIADLNTRENSTRYKDGLGQQVTLVLQSENDSKKKYLAYNVNGSKDSFLKSYDHYTYYIIEKQYLKNKQEKEKEEQEKRREEEKKLAEERQKREEKINDNKKELTDKYGTATAANIMAGKFSVGMSKKACKETMQSLTNQVVSLGIPNAYMSRVISSTATSEVWETYLQGLFGGQSDGPFMHLYFNGDKLVKIIEKKRLFR